MKTLLISEIFPPKVGGSGRWFWEIYSRLSSENYLIAAGEDVDAAHFDTTHNLKCFRLPLTMAFWGVRSLKGIRSYSALFLKLLSIFRSERIRSIHCGRCLPEGLLAWGAKKLFKLPYLVYVHGEELAIYQSSKELRLLSNMVYSGAHRIIVNSENSQKLFTSVTGLPGTSIRMMHPGVDTSYFIPTKAVSTWRTQMRWDGKLVLLTVGRLQKRKGHDHVIMALKKIMITVPDVLYAIVGDGEERASLEDLVYNEGVSEHVQFLGKVDDATMLKCYQHCDLFILANREVDGDFEGFGMVLVEAQACGKPVIAGKSGGTAETMEVGESGFLVDADNIDEIAELVIKVMSNHAMRQRMGTQATKFVRSIFDWNVLVNQAEIIYRELN